MTNIKKRSDFNKNEVKKMNKIDLEKVKENDVVLKLDANDVDILKKVSARKRAIKCEIAELTEILTKNQMLVDELWNKYTTSEESDILLKKDLMFTMSIKEGVIKISKITKRDILDTLLPWFA